jgi:hypothetical protein
MGLLDSVRTGKRPGPRRVLLYGVQGIGKSTWGAQAPGAVFIPTEDGLDDIDGASFPKATSYDGMLACIGIEHHAARVPGCGRLAGATDLAEVCRKRHLQSKTWAMARAMSSRLISGARC